VNSLIIGASAGLGRALAGELAGQGHNLFLVASDKRDLEALANELSIMHRIKVGQMAVDLRHVDPHLLRTTVHDTLGAIHNIFIVAGLYRLEHEGCKGAEVAEESIAVNFTSPIKIIETLLGDFESAGTGNIVGIGSVAAIRPRRTMPVYAASKRGLEFYIQAIRHRLADTNCHVQFYRMGYISTQMNFGKRLPLPPVAPEDAARAIVQGLGKNINMTYFPFWWRYIAIAYKLLPWFIFKRLSV